MKAHIGVDPESGLVHAVVVAAAHVSDVSQTHKLLHGEEMEALRDAGYQGVDKHEENRDNKATGHVAMKREASTRRSLRTGWVSSSRMLEPAKTSLRAKVEHLFHVVKYFFKHRRTRYPGLAKNVASSSPSSVWPIWCWRAGRFGGSHPRCVLMGAKARKAGQDPLGPHRNG